MKALIVCTWDWYYYSHRRTIAKLLMDAGYEVTIITRIYHHREQILADGVNLIELPFSRPSLNPFREYPLIRSLRKIYQREQPDLVYHIAFKPVLYGSLAARNLDIPVQVNAIAGMGQLFLGSSLKIRVLRRFVLSTLKRLFRNPRTRLIVQNQTDLAYLQSTLEIPSDRLHLIKGVGIDLNAYSPASRCLSSSSSSSSSCSLVSFVAKPRITMVSRLIKEKGILELISAARLLKNKGLEFELHLIGDPDFDSPQQIAASDLRQWQSEGLITWTGFRDDIAEIYRHSDIAVLPSYSEGLPKSLLEAAACGLPIVTTDTSGCREVVDVDQNGYLVPIRDPESLAAALEKLILDPELRHRFGRHSRHKAETEFGLDLILRQTAHACGL